MKQYNRLVRDVIYSGTRKENRTGVDTISLFNYNMEFDLDEGFPLMTTKEVSWKNIVVELLWFLSGETDLRIMHKHKSRFWDAWADENGELGPVYGHQWRNWLYATGEDQLQRIIETLQKNPNDRRLILSAWNVSEIDHMALPPCHLMGIFNVQYKNGEPRLCLHLTQRSCDIALGLPYNIASYSLLLAIVGHITGIRPWKFAHSIVDAHIYTKKADGSMSEYDHIPGLFKQVSMADFPALPKLEISDDLEMIYDFVELAEASTEEVLDKIKIVDYNPLPPIKFKVAV